MFDRNGHSLIYLVIGMQMTSLWLAPPSRASDVDNAPSPKIDLRPDWTKNSISEDALLVYVVGHGQGGTDEEASQRARDHAISAMQDYVGVSVVRVYNEMRDQFKAQVSDLFVTAGQMSLGRFAQQERWRLRSGDQVEVYAKYSVPKEEVERIRQEARDEMAQREAYLREHVGKSMGASQSAAAAMTDLPTPEGDKGWQVEAQERLALLRKEREIRLQAVAGRKARSESDHRALSLVATNAVNTTLKSVTPIFTSSGQLFAYRWLYLDYPSQTWRWVENIHDRAERGVIGIEGSLKSFRRDSDGVRVLGDQSHSDFLYRFFNDWQYLNSSKSYSQQFYTDSYFRWVAINIAKSDNRPLAFHRGAEPGGHESYFFYSPGFHYLSDEELALPLDTYISTHP